MKPALTIVVPLYNSAATIEKLVAELSALPVEGGCEIVLVNDGSTDRTGQIAEEMSRADARIRVIHHDRPGGIGFSWNRYFKR